MGQAQLNHEIGVGSTEFHLIRPREEIDNRYLLHFLRTPSVRSTGELRMTGSVGQRRVPADFLKKLQIPLPPLEEQRRIAAILDHADAIRIKRRQSQSHFDAIEQAIYNDMFGETRASGTVAEFAASKKAAIRTGPFGSQLLHNEFVDEGVAVLGLDNVVDNEFRWGVRRFITREKYERLARYTVFSDDVLISIMGTVGRCVVVPKDIGIAINTKHLCAISVDRDKLDPVFLRASFLWHQESWAHLVRQTKGSIMNGLNMGIIKTMPIPAPPIQQQKEYACRVESLQELRRKLRRLSELDDELFASLQARAFKGEL